MVKQLEKNNSTEFSKEEENKDLIKEKILNEYKDEPITISRSKSK